eukprot:COSAG02_NODE_57338_length_281_cov_0.571429_2_plen_71_part_01
MTTFNAFNWQASIWIYYGGNGHDGDDSASGDGNESTATLMMTPMELPGEGLKERGLNACACHNTIAISTFD